jgi:hypothetical protein
MARPTQHGGAARQRTNSPNLRRYSTPVLQRLRCVQRCGHRYFRGLLAHASQEVRFQIEEARIRGELRRQAFPGRRDMVLGEGTLGHWLP